MFRAKQFLVDHFQTPRGLIAFLNAHGVEAPAEGTVDKWFRRAGVPTPWFPVILVCLEIDRGKPVRLRPYLQEGVFQ